MRLMNGGLKALSRKLMACLVALIMLFGSMGLGSPGSAWAKPDESPAATEFIGNIDDNGEEISVLSYAAGEMGTFSVSDAVYYSPSGEITAIDPGTVTFADGQFTVPEGVTQFTFKDGGQDMQAAFADGAWKITGTAIVQVSTWDEFKAAISNAAGDTIVDLTSDITIGEHYDINSQYNVTITSSSNKKLISVATKMISVYSHVTFKNIEISGNPTDGTYTMLGPVYVHTDTDNGRVGSIDVDNVTFSCPSGANPACYIYMQDPGTSLTIHGMSVASASAALKGAIYLQKESSLSFQPTSNIDIASPSIFAAKGTFTIPITPQSGYSSTEAAFNNEDLTDALNALESGASYPITLNVTASKGQAYATPFQISVSEAPETYPVTIGSLTNGAITAAPTSAAAGDTVTLTVAPSKAISLRRTA